MSMNPPNNPDSTTPPSNPSQNMSWREQRRAERQARRAARYGSRGGAGVAGVILILVGVIFLLQNISAIVFGNWWALFILLPAVGSFRAAWRSFSFHGQFTVRVIASLIVGLFFTALTIVLFFNLNLTWIGPILLIVFGIGVLAAALMRPGGS